MTARIITNNRRIRGRPADKIHPKQRGIKGDRETCEPLVPEDDAAAGELDDEDEDAKKRSSGGERGARRSAAASGLREMSIIAGSLGLLTLNRRKRPDATRRDAGGARERCCRGGRGNKCRVA
jgi:hypothetical protein